MKLEIAIEAALFYKTEPVTKQELGEFFGVSLAETERALTILRERLSTGGTRLLDTGENVQLVSAPEVAEVIEKLRKEELSREIGKAGAETLAIVLYRGPVSRAQIDFIRGVNSGYILRSLQVHGLVERRDHPTRANAFEYVATPALYTHLGITRKEDLPEYALIADEINAFEQASDSRSTGQIIGNC